MRIDGSLYYEDQRREAGRRSEKFLALRAPKYLYYFERVLARNQSGGTYLVGARLSSADLSVFQVVDGLRVARECQTTAIASLLHRTAALHSD